MKRNVVEIVEVGPRDGLQDEARILPTHLKVEFIRRLIGAGIRRLEVASFVNPRKVPQMADAEAVLELLGPPQDVRCIGLVLNQKGCDRALAAGCNEIGMVVPATETFGRRNQGQSLEDSIAAWRSIARASRAAGIPVQVTIAVAFGCPLEGEVSIERVIDIVRRVAESDPQELALADTIGVAVPGQVTDLIGSVRDVVPGVPIRLHVHNTRGTGLANAYAALQAGVASLDASVGGLGGCPFAPGAAGNIATEDLVYMLDRSGVDSGVSLGALLETSAWLQEQIGHALPGMLLKAGPFPRHVPERAQQSGASK